MAEVPGEAGIPHLEELVGDTAPVVLQTGGVLLFGIGGLTGRASLAKGRGDNQ